MEKVRLLILQAWAEARAQGVIIEDVQFDIINNLGERPVVSNIHLAVRISDNQPE